jgi:SWI/SNF-related matrix-associated actin-dependent regulator 1 of chromatin subfamily A
MKTNKSIVPTAAISGDLIRLIFHYNDYLIRKIKEIPGNKWDKETKTWMIPLTLDNCVWIKNTKYFSFTDSLKKWANAQWKINKIEFNFGKLDSILFPYQKEGVKFILKNQGRALIADEMGLGKTIQAIAWLNTIKFNKALVICPGFLKINWKREFYKFSDFRDIMILEGKTPTGNLSKKILIINYEILNDWKNQLKLSDIDVIIIDEIHYVKNSKALRTKALFSISRNIENVVGLSGTPIMNRPAEIYNSIKIISPGLFPNKWKFLQRYCGPVYNGFGWNFDGASNIPELNKILTNSIMIRRKKQDVLTDLPDKLYTFIPIPIDNRKLYNMVEQDFIEYMNNRAAEKFEKEFAIIQKQMEKLGLSPDTKDWKDEFIGKEKQKAIEIVKINILKKVAALGKIKAIKEWIDNFLESGKKLIIFCEHLEIMQKLYSHYSGVSVCINGGVPMKKRDELQNQFQTDPVIQLFFGNRAAQEGLNLTAADSVAHIEFPWRPGDLLQRTDRTHRIGQKNTVNVFYLTAENTIEEKIATLCHEKQFIIDQVLDGNLSENTTILQELINSFKK